MTLTESSQLDLVIARGTLRRGATRRSRVTVQLTEPSRHTVAYRIRKQHNSDFDSEIGFGRPGGLLVFDPRGRLLRWQHSDTHDFTPTELVYPRRMTKVTTAEVIAWLEARDGSAPDATTFDLYGSAAKKPIEEPVR